MLLYSRKKVRYRRDGYCWKKRKDGKTTREDHMKLKVQGTEVSQIANKLRQRNNETYDCLIKISEENARSGNCKTVLGALRA